MPSLALQHPSSPHRFGITLIYPTTIPFPISSASMSHDIYLAYHIMLGVATKTTFSTSALAVTENRLPSVNEIGNDGGTNTRTILQFFIYHLKTYFPPTPHRRFPLTCLSHLRPYTSSSPLLSLPVNDAKL